MGLTYQDNSVDPLLGSGIPNTDQSRCFHQTGSIINIRLFHSKREDFKQLSQLILINVLQSYSRNKDTKDKEREKEKEAE